MNRRIALKSFGLGLLAIPAWANGWSIEKIKKMSYLPDGLEETLLALVETILPEGAEPGAKSLGIDQFILKFTKEVVGETGLKTLQEGIASIDILAEQNHKLKFIDLNTTQKLMLLKKIESENTALQQLKGMSVWAYTSSEYFMNTHTDYNMAPGFYNGCVPIKTV